MKPFEGTDTDYINRKEWEGFMFMFMFMKADRRHVQTMVHGSLNFLIQPTEFEDFIFIISNTIAVFHQYFQCFKGHFYK